MKQIPFAKVVCDGNELAYIREVLESGWLTTADKAHRFEKEFAALIKVPYVFAVNSCTAALHLALEALGVGPVDCRTANRRPTPRQRNRERCRSSPP